MSRITRFTLCRFIALLALIPSLAVAGEPTLAVTGAVKTPLKLTLADLKTMALTTVKAKDHDGSTATYEGVALSEILHKAGVPQGEALRSEALQLCAVVKGADGYQAVFSLAELDPMFTDKVVLLAFRRDGSELDLTTGPLRLILPDEKRQTRSVRQVVGIEITRVNSGSKQ